MSQPAEIHTLAGAYALDALTEIERTAFSRHVAECQACAAELAELTGTPSRLGAAWAPPPSRLCDAVLAQVARTRQVTAGRPDRTDRNGDVRLWRRRTAAAVAAGVIAPGGMGTVWVVQEQRVGDARRVAQRLEDAQARVGLVLAAGDAQIRTASVPGGGTVTVAVSRTLDDGVVLMDNLPAPPEGKVHQLWLIEGTRPTSIGVPTLPTITGVSLV